VIPSHLPQDLSSRIINVLGSIQTMYPAFVDDPQINKKGK
jgi:hypothetical protein